MRAGFPGSFLWHIPCWSSLPGSVSAGLGRGQTRAAVPGAGETIGEIQSLFQALARSSAFWSITAPDGSFTARASGAEPLPCWVMTLVRMHQAFVMCKRALSWVLSWVSPCVMTFVMCKSWAEHSRSLLVMKGLPCVHGEGHVG
jgi:hypothetical protein